jgi:two-component system response regulator AlgR
MPLEGPVLVVSDRGRLLRLPVSEVLVLKAELKYVTLRTAARSVLLDDSLAELEQRVGALGGDFLRIHRNALVARRAIRELALRGTDDESGGEGWAVRVAPLDEWLAVSRRQVGAVRAALEKGRT